MEDEKEAMAARGSDVTDGNRARDLPARSDSVLDPHLSRPNLYILASQASLRAGKIMIYPP